jgi:hypothetical protein
VAGAHRGSRGARAGRPRRLSPDVGVVGYTVGGGLSWFGRKHGLACSALLSAEVVTADGQVRRVDADHDADLFWALRGGGGGVAVVTALELQLWPVSEVQAGALFWPVERGPEVWRAWRSWVDTLPEATTSWARYLSFPPIPDVPEPLRATRSWSWRPATRRCGRGGGPPAADAGARTGPRHRRDHPDDRPQPRAHGPGLAGARRRRGDDAGDLPEQAIEQLVRVAGPGSGSPLLSLEVRHLGGQLSRPADGALESLRAQFAVFAVGVTPDADSEARVRAHCDTCARRCSPGTPAAAT